MMNMSFILEGDEMFSVITFIIAFFVTYFIYYFIFDDLLKKEKYMKISELVILTKKFNLDKKKMNYRSLLNGVAIINAFILAFTLAVVLWLPVPEWLLMIIAFIMIIVLIIVMYFIYGKKLNKKWGK